MVWRYGPVELENLWDGIQNAVKEMWEGTGQGRSMLPLRRMRALYNSHAAVRNRHLQYWERQHMCMHDLNRHRAARFSVRTRHPLHAVHTVCLVRALLLRWTKTLKRQERVAEIFQRRLMRQCKKKLAERRHLELARRKRAREEQQAERFRRQALRKRMMSEVTMDDILGSLDLLRDLVN